MGTLIGWTERAAARVSAYSEELSDELQSIPLPSGFKCEHWDHHLINRYWFEVSHPTNRCFLRVGHAVASSGPWFSMHLNIFSGKERDAILAHSYKHYSIPATEVGEFISKYRNCLFRLQERQ
jgi:hypothetical protein